MPHPNHLPAAVCHVSGAEPFISKEFLGFQWTQVWPLVMVPLAESCLQPASEFGYLAVGSDKDGLQKGVVQSRSRGNEVR